MLRSLLNGNIACSVRVRFATFLPIGQCRRSIPMAPLRTTSIVIIREVIRLIAEYSRELASLFGQSLLFPPPNSFVPPQVTGKVHEGLQLFFVF